MFMRVAIAGAGNVGRSIAQELIENGHQVMLLERQPRMLRPERVPAADWVLADACELSSLQEINLAACDVVVAATGDDKVNLVVSLLAKTEFAVPRVVARVNRAENEWLFTEQWGVDVSVSKPRLMAALVEEAVTVGDLVRLMTFRQGEANLVEITLPEDAPHVGQPIRDIPLPPDSALVAIVRGRRVLTPTPDDPVESGDELVFVCTVEVEEQVRSVILGADSVEKTRSRRR
nr:TrkA family potassium uptake protein [Catellatospora bangladeshensis]